MNDAVTREGVPPAAASRSEVRVVDLSRTPAFREVGTPLHAQILNALRQAPLGLLTRDELLNQTPGHSFSDVELALRDLSLRGLVRVVWRTAFRFVAFLAEEKPSRPAQPWGTFRNPRAAQATP